MRAKDSENAGSKRGPACTKMTRASAGSNMRNSLSIPNRANSAMAPESSIPVGPPPTIRKVRRDVRSAGSRVASDPRKVHRSLHTEIVPTLISIAFEGTSKNGDAMSDKTASVHWEGRGKQGVGKISTQTDALKSYPYGYGSRFEDDRRGTNL